jgi:hypothetical protein
MLYVPGMRHFYSIAFLLLASLPLSAQSLGSSWFLGIGAGVGAHDNGPLSRRLQSYTPAIGGEQLLYRTEDFPNIGATLNASAGVLVNENLLIGLNGESISFPTVRSRSGPGNAQDEYRLSAIGGGLDFGYAVVINDGGTLIYPFLHAGYHQYELQFTNNQRDSIPFFESRPVPSKGTAVYSGGAPRIAIGLGLTRYLGGLSGGSGSGTSGLFIVNARLTYGRMPSRPEWEQNGEVVNNGGHTPEYNAVTLSVTIGVGSGE